MKNKVQVQGNIAQATIYATITPLLMSDVISNPANHYPRYRTLPACGSATYPGKLTGGAVTGEIMDVNFCDLSGGCLSILAERHRDPNLSVLALSLRQQQSTPVKEVVVSIAEPQSESEDWDFDAIEAFMGTSEDAAARWQQASLNSSIWEEIEV